METGIPDKENSTLFLHKFIPAVLVCVLVDEGDPVADHLWKTKGRKDRENVL